MVGVGGLAGGSSQGGPTRVVPSWWPSRARRQANPGWLRGSSNCGWRRLGMPGFYRAGLRPAGADGAARRVAASSTEGSVRCRGARRRPQPHAPWAQIARVSQQLWRRQGWSLLRPLWPLRAHPRRPPAEGVAKHARIPPGLRAGHRGASGATDAATPLLPSLDAPVSAARPAPRAARPARPRVARPLRASRRTAARRRRARARRPRCPTSAERRDLDARRAARSSSRFERSIDGRLRRPRREHDRAHVEAGGARGLERQQRVVDRAEARAARRRRAAGRASTARSRTRVAERERDEQAADALDDEHVGARPRARRGHERRRVERRAGQLGGEVRRDRRAEAQRRDLVAARAGRRREQLVVGRALASGSSRPVTTGLNAADAHAARAQRRGDRRGERRSCRRRCRCP